MTQISIAVPVFNGETMLREALECLRAQTFRDFEVLILDNCSTDGTHAIAQSFVDQDPRFRLITQPTNIGAMANFTSGLRAATAPFFLWRAFDDVTDDRYLELLHDALIRDERKVLATGLIRTMLLDGARDRIFNLPKLGGGELSDIRTLLFECHAGWFYGLWRREPLLEVWEDMLPSFPYPWASDHLVMFAFLIDRTVAFEERTTFIKYHKRRDGDPRDPTRPPAAEMMQYRREFSAWCEQRIDRTFKDRAFMRRALHILLFFYVNKRVYRLTTIARRWIAERF